MGREAAFEIVRDFFIMSKAYEDRILYAYRHTREEKHAR